jgi:putative transcriptional regulator
MKSLAGKFLVASPQLTDPNFAQTVVFIAQHTEEGALGVVLNRPSEKSISDVWKLLEKKHCDSTQLVHIGGPVPGPLLALHTLLTENDQEIIPGLYLTAQEDAFETLIRQTEENFRLFSGHAGWAGGQLENELQAGGWLSSKATVDDVFSDHKDLWKRMTSRIGLSILVPGVRPEQIPKDPGLN